MQSRASQMSLDKQGGCLSIASFRPVQTHREAQGTRRQAWAALLFGSFIFGHAK